MNKPYAFMLLLGITLSAAASAQPAPASRPSDFMAGLLSPPKTVTTAPAADFGAAAAACATTIGNDGLDLSKLAGLGWTAIPLPSTVGEKYYAYERSSTPVRIYLSTTITAKGQCVVDGFGTSKGQFGAIAGEVKKQVAAITGKKVKETGSSSSPGGFSQGKGFLADDLMTIVSSESRTEGLSIRVTLMRMDPSKDPYELASAAGMAGQFLPTAIEGLIAEAKAPAAQPNPSLTPKP